MTLLVVALAGVSIRQINDWENARYNATICAMFNGSNLRDLACQFHLALRHLAREIGRM
jgi:Mor family transcriptional regulator